ncbi:ATPase [Salmonella enterica subsp. enterica serovar Kottbus]|nr:ATPase [Salmonella enterica]EDL0052381.1 ATPase [Salmonella enterica subsp. enterica serovar Kottbus]HCK3133577.1 AAA family ATPase [Salmonella enterica subsp. enterica serovar Ruiru]EDL0056020.1 ATPase [Salmonella enterica subsp. enterica serovar Kottbus]EDL0122741.1 ATPase [Salmonella enterica subsp. enterica serovar Kottbus]
MEKLITQLKSVMERRGYSQSYIAREIGRSVAVINQFLQGKYKGDMAGLALKITDFIQSDDDRIAARFKKPVFAETSLTREAVRVIDFARKYGTICAITGVAGIGKSMILEEYARSHPNVLLLEVGAGFTPRAFMNALLKLIKPTESHQGTTATLTGRCISELASARRLILIDEAELLPYQTLEALRRLYDTTSIGVVLAGMPKLTDNLLGENGTHTQLHSRVARYFELPDGLGHDDFCVIAKQMMPEAEDEAICNLLFEYSGGNGRRMSNIVRGVYEESERRDMPVSLGLMKICTESLMASQQKKNNRKAIANIR